MQHSCSHSNAICNQRFKNRIELRTQTQPLVAKHIGGTIRGQNDRSRTRRTDEVPFIVACSHFTRKNTRFRAPASSPQHSPCDIHAAIPMQSATRDSRTIRTQTQPLVAKHIGGTIRGQNDRSRTRRTDEVPFIVACSHFTRKNTRFRALASSPNHHFPSSPLPFLTTSIHHHVPSSPLPFVTTPLHHHVPSSPLPFFTTSLPHHFPSSPLPFLTTSLLHHSPSSPLPFLTTSLRHHFPSSALPFFTTSLRQHFPSSPLPFVTTPLHHHFPSSPLPFVTTSLLHHFPSSPLPFVTTPLHHHFPSSPLPFVTTPLHHHVPSSPLPFVITTLPPCNVLYWTTTLHHFLLYWTTTLHHFLLYWTTTLHQFLFVRNTEVLLPNFLWSLKTMRKHHYPLVI